MGKNLTSLLKQAVICARVGRTIASLGAYLTSAEQELISEIYSRLVNGEKIDDDTPAIAYITPKKGRKRKISMSEAVKWFTGKYNRWSIPLQKKLKEKKPPKIKTILAYGLNEGRDFDDESYIKVLKDITNIPESQAENLYEQVVKRQLSKLDELSGLIEIEIKQETSS